MKKITLTFAIFLTAITLIAQPPQSFKYQAVVRDSIGNILANNNVSFQISILQGSITGTSVYTETHDTTTNEFGLVNLEIGNGTIVNGDFSNINWGSDSFFLQFEMDEAGGTNYQLIGTSQLLSVPYSLNSGSLTLTSPNGANYLVTVDDNGNLTTNCTPMPSVADAGPDQDSISVPATLAATLPQYGDGVWSIVAGTGGSFSDTTNPASEFTGIPGYTYSLLWTVSNLCGYTDDDVNISFFGNVPQPCPGIPTVIYDEQIYNTVLIGDQCWLKENLNIGTRINGVDTAFNNGTIEKYCYDDLESNCDTYGGLYLWNEMMQYTTTEGAQGICPAGWHIPTDDEWKILEGTVDSQYPVGDPEWDITGMRGFDAGLNLKSITGWMYDGNGTDLYGFTGLPVGKLNGHAFYNLGYACDFWSSTEYNTYAKLNRNLQYSNDGAARYNSWFTNGFSVRCLLD